MSECRNVVYVEWTDACKEDGGPLRIMKLRGPVSMHSAGIFVSEDDEVLTIAQDWLWWEGEISVRNVLVIPKMYITARATYRVKDPRRRRRSRKEVEDD